VLKTYSNRALLITENIIERRPYNDKYVDTSWENCALRKYFNGELYDSFSKEEEALIAETSISNNNNPWYGTIGGRDTKDKMFLLSIEEVIYYFGDSGDLKNRKGWYRGNNRFVLDELFTGDMETRSERDLLGRFTKVDVLKSSHHGSRTSSNVNFLNITQPDYVIISCALKNSYNHPHYTALQRYFDIGATVYGTFKDGTIVMTTDGKTYSIDATNKVTIADAGDRKTNTDDATVKNNKTENQNGVAYIGNSSTKRLHFPGCDSVTQMSERNRVEFNSISEASGYDPCGICKPQ